MGGRVAGTEQARAGWYPGTASDAPEAGGGAERGAGAGRQLDERIGQPAEPTVDVPGAERLLEVGDAAERRRCPEGGGPGVGRVAVHVLHEPGVGERGRRPGVEGTQGVDGEQVARRLHPAEELDRRRHGRSDEPTSEL